MASPLPALARIGVVVAVAAAATAAGVEAYSRHAGLDRLQLERMPVAAQLVTPPPQLSAVDYLPREFRLDAQGFDTAFGRCDLGWPGRTLLALGDSTTVQTTVDGQPEDHQGSWPLLVGQALGPDWQICVLAEDGYHPSDLATLWQALDLDLQPDLAVLLMCSNDLVDRRPRSLVQEGGQTFLAWTPDQPVVWRQLWNPWLYQRSEAYRHFTWRMALATDDAARIPTQVQGRPTGPALAALDDALDLLVFYLPDLVAGQGAPPALARLAQEGGVEIQPVQTGADPEALRREPIDPVHLNEAGHARVAQQVLAANAARSGDPG